ncbi:RluA family pseudouridine synthase [Bdellovibrio sp. HCB337]|uniref:RluA family pseudouridine synthase n=1 Tax=Bdellovibrio sp. HCB337 TaxID=3394358 RepID=UPI0039A51F51
MAPLKILHETPEWLVVDKPAGLSVHNATPNVLTLLQLQKPGVSFHLVHRLDQETSGVLLLAKNPKTAATLMETLNHDSTTKKYQAILRGKMKSDSESWQWALTDKAEGRKNPQGIGIDRKHCTTLVKVLQSNDYFTWVECEILTGRQHQIRKHAAIAKHPIVGDSRYNDPKYNERIFGLYPVTRMFLHAFELKITIDKREWVFTSPVSAEFKTLFP